MTNPQGPAQKLRARLKTTEIVTAPGVYDHMSMRIAQRAGFDTLYASGYWNAASALGEPDVGIAGATDFVGIFRRYVEKSGASIIADADTGFGSLTNLDRAVKSYQHAKIAAIQLEDQGFPKICGHVGRASSVSTEEMVRRVRVAVEARGEGDILIIARTDARRSEGLDAALARLSAYAGAGADILFLEAPENEEEISRAAHILPKPLLLNAAHGGVTPILSPARYQELGARLVIYPAGAPLSAAYAARAFYTALAQGDANIAHENMFDFDDMSEMMGMSEVIEFQERHGQP